VYYVVNNDHTSPVTTDLTFRGVGATVEIWDPVTGEGRLTSFKKDKGRTALTLTLEAGDAVFVVIGHGKPSVDAIPPITEEDYPVATGPWTVTFDPPRGTPDVLELTLLGSLSDSTDFNTKYYSGTMIYTGTLNTTVNPAGLPSDARLLLDLGEVNEFAQVVLNGKELNTTLWRAPYRVDVTDVLVPGDNSIVVRVTNGWYNRVLGDRQPGVTDKYSTGYNGDSFGVSANGTINRSGLVGPISIVVERGRQTIGT
jgi:hypothetical protein